MYSQIKALFQTMRPLQVLYMSHSGIDRQLQLQAAYVYD
jgi:hypothetical protein